MKSEILRTLKLQVTEEMQKLANAHKSAKNLATGDEAKAESKWDTRGLEASYLTSAYEKRVGELKQELQILNEVVISEKRDLTAEIGSIVELLYNNRKQMYFISPTAGGTAIQINGQPYLVISVFSPIGTEILGLKAGDTFEVEINPQNIRTYSILNIL